MGLTPPNAGKHGGWKHRPWSQPARLQIPADTRDLAETPFPLVIDGKVLQFFKKLNTELLYDPANPLLGIYPKEVKTDVQTNTCTHIFRAALFTIAKR